MTRRTDYLFLPGALSEGLPVVSWQLEAPEVPAWGPGFPPSGWLDSWTWSFPKYEKPGEDPSGLTQWAAEAPAGATPNAATAATVIPTTSFFLIRCHLFLDATVSRRFEPALWV